MDGAKRIRNSLQFRLSVQLTAGLVLFSVVTGAISFFRIHDEAEELMDRELRQVAMLVMRQQISLSGPIPDAPAPDMRRAFIVQPLSAGEKNSRRLELPEKLKDGFQSASIGGKKWRLFVSSMPSGERFAVAQRPFFQNKIAREGMMAIFIPFLCLAGIAALSTCLLVRHLFRPLREMASGIDKRDEQDLSPIRQRSVPSELIPFIESLNRMFARVALSIEMQRRFIADAAHELRSPMAALSLQAERLDAVEMPVPARKRLNVLRCGLDRTCSLLNQLLALASAQGHRKETLRQISLMALFRQVLADMLPLAGAKNIDLGIASEEDATVMLSPMAAVSILKNLVDNAIRYTPEGGRIDLYAGYTDGAPFLAVADTGPGIPPAEMARVFDPFYRVLGSGVSGSGLGLSIVKTLAENAGGTVTLENRHDGSGEGLRVTVLFPPQYKRAAPSADPSAAGEGAPRP